MLLVTGATGNVGAEVVNALAAADHQVRALVASDKARGLPPGVEAVRGDLNRPESLAGALAGVRGVFLLSGYADMEGVLAEVRAAGVERVVLLSGSSAASGDMRHAARGRDRSHRTVGKGDDAPRHGRHGQCWRRGRAGADGGR